MSEGAKASSSAADEHRWRERAVAALVVALPLVVLFGPALVTDRSFAMRDAGHYYYPLFKWCADEWGAGRVPLVSSLENGGTAIYADPTASIWYPGKLLFVLPLDFSVNYKLYIVAHVMLCAAAAYWLARRWGGSRYAAALGALSYSCGGSVVFQYANVVYLVGAAWLPVAAGLVDDVFRLRQIGSAACLGIVLALIVFGGDAQMAYHVLLLGGLYAVVLGCSRRRVETRDNGPHHRPGQTALIGLSCTALAAVLAYLLAAVQILPSDAAMQTSDREGFTNPRTILEMVRGTETHNLNGDQVLRGLFGAPQPGTHHRALYDFSVAPWRLAELIWPNIGGRMFPTHRRWFSLLPDDSRIWTPTLYMGLVPLVLGLGVFSLRSEDPRVRWLSWAALVFTLGSFGTFGLGWLARHALGLARGAEAPIGDGVGGVYWLFVVLLPKYVLFRYPAKLMVVAALGISQLAAIGWDRARAAPPKRLIRLLLALSVLSGAAALVALVAAAFVVLGREHADPVFGPFDSRGAWTDIWSALVQTSVVSLLSAWLLHRASLSSAGPSSRWSKSLLVALCAAELTLANYWLVQLAPAGLWRERSPIAAALDADRPRARLFRAQLPWPDEYGTTSSPRRIEELVEWERTTLAGRYGLLDGVAVVNSQVAVLSARQRELLDALEAATAANSASDVPAELAVDYLLAYRRNSPSFGRRVAAAGLPEELDLLRLPTLPQPRTEPPRAPPSLTALYRGAWLSGVSWVAALLVAVAAWLYRRGTKSISGQPSPR